jgi:hypothetical protein
MRVKPGKWNSLIKELRKAGVLFSDGLSDEEIARAEEQYCIRFPPDLRAFLQTASPKGIPFPDWRSADSAFIREMLDWPLHGLLFDVEHNVFWLSEWGTRPDSLEDAKHIAEQNVRQAPKLIPVYSHRMMPERPHAAGNPVLSVHQMDIIHYGFDLEDYFRHEFHLDGREPWPDKIREIEFWDVDRFQDLRLP